MKILLEKMESFLLNSDWFAGDDITIADFSFLASVTTIKVRLKIHFRVYPTISINIIGMGCQPKRLSKSLQLARAM